MFKVENVLILIVDDEKVIVDMVKCVFVKEGYYNIKIVGSVEEVIEFVKYEIVDLFVLDVMMEGMFGFEVCIEIWNYIDVLIFFLIVWFFDVDKLLGFVLGVDDYIIKLFNLFELVVWIRVMLKRIYKCEEKMVVKMYLYSYFFYLL